MVLKEIQRSIVFYIVKFDNLLIPEVLGGIKFYNKSWYFCTS